jgi:predicted dehydrogenase/threonine dehydrogenase-like Zn-dependent dehydrogenase
MRQVTQNYKTGRIRVEQVTEPSCPRSGVVVRTAYSVISAGTEGMKVKEGKMSLLGKARARPDQVKKVLRTLRQQGPIATFEKVMNRLDSLTPLGYSLSGVVVDVGADAGEFQRGQRVACGGAECAFHADLVAVPRNLVVPVPDTVSLRHACFATVGSIALQGYRRAEMQLGETAAVIGLGLLGQILVRILRAAGIRAVGVDVAPARFELAASAGAACFTPDDPALRSAVRAQPGGGVDCVFITAGGSSNGPAELAVEIARDRARVVDVGKTRLDLQWNDWYMKELDLRFSRSYGPGRYDPVYEQEGVDYPAGYVRWTERRNMSSFLALLAGGGVDLEPIITDVRGIDEAEDVYEAIARGEAGLGMVFEYPEALERTGAPAVTVARREAPLGRGRARLGFIGAGNYASTMLLPHLARLDGVELVEVVTRTGLSGANARRRFPFQRASTDVAGLLAADDVDAVLIATRHSTHPRLVSEALRTGRPVFVEKPLAIDLAGLELVRQALVESGNDRLQVGFNRRFAPLVLELASVFQRRAAPLFMSYRVHAGQLESTSWYADAAEGTRFEGEGGHFLDVFAFLTGSRPLTVSAASLRPAQASADDQDNVAVTVRYQDGSVGTLLYLTQGGSRVPKEELEVFGDGKTAQLHNFAHLDVYAGDGRRSRSSRLDKGQRAEMAAFVEAVRTGGSMPVPLECLFDTTMATLAVSESLRRGGPVDLSEYWAPAPDESPARARVGET